MLYDWVRDDFGVELTSLTPVFGGADAGAETWRGITADETSYAVKRSRSGMTTGLLVSAHLATAGVPGIPTPLTARSGQPWSVRDGAELSVTPWVRGRPAMDVGLTVVQWRAFGELLGQVHATTLPADITTRLPADDDLAGVLSTTRSLGATMRDRRPGGDRLSRTMIDGWLGAAAEIGKLVQRAETLDQQLRDRPAPTVLCHSDAHLINVLIEPTGPLWLIDWDSVTRSARERDLMFVIGGIFTDDPVTPLQQQWFFSGYGDVEIDPARLAYYRCTRTLDDLNEFAIQILNERGRSAAERDADLVIFRHLLAPTGMLNFALS